VNLSIPEWATFTAEDQFTDPLEVTGADTYVVHATATGSPSAISVILQGSLDGENWFTLGTAQGSPTWVTGKPVRAIRAYLDEMSGGSSPTVSVALLAL
jgi:hypothetical protein